MIRLIKQSGQFFGINIGSLNGNDEEIENIEIFTSESTPVILVESLEDLRDLGINSLDVIMVD